jgi:site-specific DNA-methyltransferase (adenine-specific)
VVNNDSNEKIHPNQKPVGLFEYLIRTFSDEGAVVLDNCIGSGTTAIACLNTGRHFIGIEQDAAFCRLANERVAHHQAYLHN